MAQFCTCGSLMINEQCTNKNCSNKAATKPVSKKSSSLKKDGEAKKTTAAAKSGRTRRASKCITYNLNDIKREENVT